MSVAERRLKEKQERTECILAAALSVFARRGLKDATIDEIAEAAELGKGTLYYYFSSKEALLEALVIETADHYFKGLLGKIEPGADLLTICNQIVDNLVDNYRKNPELFKVMYLVLAEPEHKLNRAKKLFVTKHLAWLEELRISLKPLLKGGGMPVQPFVDFIGTHTHGIVLAAVAGRSLQKIRDESSRALRAFFALTEPKKI